MTHTPGALKAAAIILHGKKMIDTEYGRKTAKGIADLIDRETAAPELLEALKMVVASVPFASYRGDGELEEVEGAVHSAIAKAEGR